MSTVQERLSRIKVHLQARQFQQVLSLTEGFGPEEPLAQAEAYVYRTEASLALGNFDAHCIDAALPILRVKGDTSLFALAKYLKARLSIVAGELVEAQEDLSEAYVYYKRLDDQRGMASCALLQSYTAYQQSDYTRFFEYVNRCLQHYSPTDNRSQIGMVLLNVALARLRLGQINDSKVILHQIKSEYFEDLRVDTRYNYYHVSALLYAQIAEFENAYLMLEEADRLPKEMKRELFRHFEISAIVYMQASRFNEAKKYIGLGEALAQEIAPKSTLISQIRRIKADCHISLTQYKSAGLTAKNALAIAQKLNERIEIAACYRVFAQVAAHDGKADEARRQFKAAIELFNQISSRYELAVTRYLAASSGLFEKGESLAMLFLAKEYCEAEQVAPYIAKIDTALAKLEPRKPALSPINRTIDGPLIAANKKMLSLLDLARHVAPTTMAVLLTGETGTGKDLLARWIHDQSGRTGRFLSQNFAALPSGLEESELFGHRKGAFTGASDEKTGLFEASEHGTFFLNEIADSPMELQAKLLEVLETKSIRRIGETNDRPVDIRIIAATNHDLAKMVRENRFRADLFHRLNEINITLPPLSARTDDIPLLVQQFIADSGVSVENGSARHIERLSSILAMREWPGNIRELRTFVRKLMMIADNDITKLVEIAQQEMPDGEEMQLARILEQSDWNQTRVADALGLSEGAVRKRIRKYGLDRI